MDDKTKNDFLYYIGTQVALARAKDEPNISFILSESNRFNFDDLIELSELMKEKFSPTWVMIDMKQKRVRARVVLK